MKKRARKLVITALAIVLGGYVALCIVARVAYPRVLFPARRIDAVPEDVAAAIAKPGGPVLLELHHPGAADTRALFFPPVANGSVVVVFHGNGETMFDEVPIAEWLKIRGMGAMLVEYRGYGLSYGAAPTEAAMYEDGEAAIGWLRDNGIGKERVALWGMSLGTGVAAEMARRGHGARLVLIAPFTSIVDVGKRFAWFLPVSLILSHRFDTLSKAGEIAVPTMVVHGDADEVIPFDMGQKVARAIRGAQLVVVKRGHHNDLFSMGSAHSPTGEELLGVLGEHLSRTRGWGTPDPGP